MLIVPLYITYFVLVIFDILNDKKISDNFDNLIYNWSKNPIKSINITKEDFNSRSNYGYDYDYNYNYDYGYNNYNRRNNSYYDRMANLVTLGNDTLEFETMKGYDYMNIFTIKNGKICGKDSFGNNLYFPNYINCPINRIFISDKNENLTGYQKLKLNNSKYLYYTNEFTGGYLFIDLKTSHNKKIPLEPRHSEYLMNLPFYEEIYSKFDGYNLNIFSVKYLGINT